MRHILMLTATLFTSALAAPLVITPSTQQAQPGALVILSASEEVTWTTSGGILGSTRGTRIVLETPKNGGNVTVTVQDPKDATRKAFAVVQVLAPITVTVPWRTHTFAAGESFSAAVSTDGSLWTWGLNDQFQVPGSKSARVNIPLRTEGLNDMSTVGTSKVNTSTAAVALAKNGTLWAWGREHPTPAAIDKNLKYVDYSYCLVGSEGDGQYFLLEQSGRTVAPQKTVAYVTSLENAYTTGGALAVVMQDGTVAVSSQCYVDDSQRGPITVSGLSNVTDVTTISRNLSIALRRDGTAVLIDNTTASPPTFRDLAGFSGIRVLASNGKRGGSGWGFVVMQDGTVRSFELDDSRIPSVPVPVRGLANIVDVSVSESHALFLRQDGTLFALGLNDDGELGNGTTQDAETPVEVIGIKVAVR